MNRMLARGLLLVYPRPWRERYGEEFENLLQAGPGGPLAILDVLLSALRVRGSARQLEGVLMTEHSTSFCALARQPSAIFPMAMSIAALTAVLIRLVAIGVAPHIDEGATAHIWQMLMAVQVPVMAWFLFQWFRKAPRLTLGIFAIQATLAVVALAPVYILRL